MGFILVSAGDGEPFFQPRRGPAVERVPPRLKSFPPELTGVDDGSPSSAPELVLFNLVHNRKDTLNKNKDMWDIEHNSLPFTVYKTF